MTLQTNNFIDRCFDKGLSAKQVMEILNLTPTPDADKLKIYQDEQQKAAKKLYGDFVNNLINDSKNDTTN